MASIYHTLRLNRFPEFKDFPIAFLDHRRYASIYDKYEYVGDAVLHMIITDLMLNQTNMSDESVTSGTLTKIRSVIESNAAFAYMADRSGLSRAAQMVGSPTKNKADLLEGIIGMLYIYLRSGHNKDRALDIIAIWLDHVFHITKVLDMIIQGKSIYTAVNLVYPVYSPWSNWSQCDLNTTRSRVCISGDCNETIETKPCYDWSPCEGGISRRRHPTTGTIEYTNCTYTTPCDEENKQYIINDLLGTREEKICAPPYIPIDATYHDATCFDGYMRLYLNTEEGPKLLDAIPCQHTIITMDSFMSLSHEEQAKEFERDLAVLEFNMIDSDEIEALRASDEDYPTKHKQVIDLLRYI